MKILRRAIADTISHIKTLIGAAFTGLLSIALLYLWKGGDLAMDEVPYVVVGLVGAGAGVVFLFLWYFASAPYRIEKEAHERTKAALEKTGAADSSRSLAMIRGRQYFTVGEMANLLAGSPISTNEPVGLASMYHLDISKEIGSGVVKPLGASEHYLTMLKLSRSNFGFSGAPPAYKADHMLQLSRKSVQSFCSRHGHTIPGITDEVRSPQSPAGTGEEKQP